MSETLNVESGAAVAGVAPCSADLGDTGLLIGGLYQRPHDSRVMMCMADHAEKGIWLTELGSDPAVTCEEDELHNWYGSRAEFDAAGWQPNSVLGDNTSEA